MSVIIPAYRAAATIGRAVRSADAQSPPPREIIVIDDGSGDGTLEAARAAAGAAGNAPVTVLTQENQGAGAARNRGLAEARGAFVAFLDADDEWLPGKLAHSLPPFDDPACVLVAHDFLRAGADGGGETRVDCHRHFAAPGDPYVRLYERGFLATSTVVARRQAVVDVGGFDTGLRTAQDFDLWLRLLAPPAARFHLFAAALTRYHVTPGSITSFTRRRLDCCLVIARRHVPALRRRGGGVLGPLWFRVLAVHYEAMAAYAAAGALPRAALTALALPLALARETLAARP
ncbi:MAG: glycosyltransferase family 2 protein [Hyphomicrobiales bacterium]|nr:glycosyltransferase family 2 protein [Hyphomicrobiales bacterium]MCP5370521.1 glycosyltransferase family 2 protein [Hyphomicrobiales bacterium]